MKSLNRSGMLRLDCPRVAKLSRSAIFALPFLTLGLCLCNAATDLMVTNRGDEVIVLYNSHLPQSKEIATHYAQRRGVPPSQIIGFDLTTNENMSRIEFRESLQRPLAAELEKRKLWHIASEMIAVPTNQARRVEWRVMHSKIRYAVLTYGVPLRILSDPNLKE